MRVTDEMICAAWNALDVALAGRLDGTEYAYGDHTPMKHALEQVFALSHAAGQEEPINPDEIDRKLVGGEAAAHIHDYGDRVRVVWDTPWQSFPPGTKFYLTPAQPPASAEVGGANCKRFEVYERVVWTSKFGTKFSGAVRHINAPEPLSYFVDLDDGTSVQRAMPSDLASSGRKESPIAGVTHGTDEGLGDLGPQGTHTQRQG